MDAARDRQLARFYDLEYKGYTDDLDFYVQYALAMDPERKLPILELGCGTGRVTLALAEAGFSVVGVDHSAGMLEVCAQQAKARGVNGKITLVQCDMRELDNLPQRSHAFNMAFCALNTFAYLTTTEDQLAALRAVRSLLVQHGVLLLDLTSPLLHLLPPSEGAMVYQGSYDDPETGSTMHKYVSGHSHPSMQLHDVRLIYDLEGSDGSLQRITQAVAFRWTGRYEMELLLQAAAYKLVRLYGSYDLDDYDDSSERMIFVART